MVIRCRDLTLWWELHSRSDIDKKTYLQNGEMTKSCFSVFFDNHYWLAKNMLNEFFLLDSSPPGQRGMTDSLLVGLLGESRTDHRHS